MESGTFDYEYLKSNQAEVMKLWNDKNTSEVIKANINEKVAIKMNDFLKPYG
ncbi:MAG: hypothetical protein WCG98_08830 [bacterium]